MSQQQTTQYYPSQPLKPYWTAGKLLVLVLVIVLGVSGLVSGLYYVTRQLATGPSPNPTSPTCANGATNYPACDNNTCSNGATDYPSCDTCGSGQSYVSGSCQQQVTITGNYVTQTYSVATNSAIDVTCNYCSITLQLANSNTVIDLELVGNSNHVTITGGQSNIDISGNYNVVDASQTIILSSHTTGSFNTIQR